MTDDPIKSALRMMPYGFYAITSRHGDQVNAMVANWVIQVAFEPRLVMLALARKAHSHALITGGRVFCVNLFAQADSEAIMGVTKSTAKNPDKMKNLRYTTAPETGCPVLEGAAAYFEVRVSQVVDTGGDHDLVIGEVIHAEVFKDVEPAAALSLPGLGWSYAG